ncbi:MAG: transcriptional regulator [Novosphingobium sp.]|jgi:DNA-binding IclR family transcriptional regulator|nr:transcriptional regulator [Novosphingobium sp.]
MTRSSPGVRRVAAILNFMASHPGQAFALSDIVRALKLSRATCHALLTGLVEVGYLYRATDKSYVLGPSLAAIGRAAAEHSSPMQIAQPEMRQLADAFDVVCGAYFLEGDMLHLRDRAASLSHVGYPVPLGTRMPLRSAQAGAFFAHNPAAAETWLKQTNAPPSAERSELMQQGMEFVRQHGFLVLVRKAGVEPFRAMPEVGMGMGIDSDDLPVIPIGSIVREEVYPVAALMAPVLDAAGRASFCLLMAGFNSNLTGEQTFEAGERLQAACGRIAQFSDNSILRALPKPV